jgi:TfoX/Sxy family transcriptional regulator of competence genes
VAFDEMLAARVRDLLADEVGVHEKRMFGGLAFLLHGHLACGVYRDELLVRLPVAEQEAALGEPGAHPFEMTRRPMRGWVLVSSDGCGEDEDLDRWVQRGIAFAATKPPK